MGGDFGHLPILDGLYQALHEKPFKVLLCGDTKQLKPSLNAKYAHLIELVQSNDVVDMDTAATDALKRKDSSIYKAVELVKNKSAQGVISAGHSGSTMALATLKLGRINGILRPAIVTLMPNVTSGKVLVLDVGANVDSKPENLLQFALMAHVYARKVLKLDKPRIGLLANGEEVSKGNELTKASYHLLSQASDINFVGNKEGNDIFKGAVDIVVCDGFEGNLLLKASEGVASLIKTIIKNELDKSTFAKLGYLLMSKVFKVIKKETDYAEVGGAPLLGVNGCVIVSHGKSNSKAIKNALFQALDFIDSKVNDDISKYIGSIKI